MGSLVRDRESQAVVVTGIGLTTALGSGREATWQALREGKSGLRTIEGLGWPEAGAPLSIAVPHDSDPVLAVLDHLADEALIDSGLRIDDPERAAALIGLSKGGIRSLSTLQRRYTRLSDPEAASLWTSSWPSAGAARVAARFGFQGPCLAPVAACATGLVAVLQGADLIRRGSADVVLAGSADASLEPVLLAAFRKMRALAPIKGVPTTLIRPWSRDRSGFLVGEGGAILVLEREDQARARGAQIYAEVAGGVLGSDAYHETNLNPDPAPLARLITRALKSTRTYPSEIDYINVHGTATLPNDPLECAAIRLALGEHADRIACSANKAQIGHLLGAAGSAELAITCLAMRDGFVPPTLNLDDPAPGCNLDGVPRVGRPWPIRTALKLSIGFGGHIAIAVLRQGANP